MTYLPTNFWGITIDDLNDFDGFYTKVSDKMTSLLIGNVDDRKRKLFDLIYSSQGELKTKTTDLYNFQHCERSSFAQQ